MTRVSEATVQRKLNHVLEVELNFVSCQRIRESIERLLQLGFEIFQSAQDFVDGCLVQRALWSINKMMHVFLKLNVSWCFHRILPFPSWFNPPLPCRFLLITRTFFASNRGTHLGRSSPPLGDTNHRLTQWHIHRMHPFGLK